MDFHKDFIVEFYVDLHVNFHVDFNLYFYVDFYVAFYVDFNVHFNFDFYLDLPTFVVSSSPPFPPTIIGKSFLQLVKLTLACKQGQGANSLSPHPIKPWVS